MPGLSLFWSLSVQIPKERIHPKAHLFPPAKLIIYKLPQGVGVGPMLVTL